MIDAIPACMSVVIGKWIVEVQDSMSDEMRNSVEWKSLLPNAAGRDGRPRYWSQIGRVGVDRVAR